MPRRRGRQRAPGGTARGRRPRDDMDDWLETDENPTERLRRDEDGKAQRLAEQFRARWHPNGNAAGGGPVQPVDALLNELRHTAQPSREQSDRLLDALDRAGRAGEGLFLVVDGDCFADNDAAWDALTSNIVRQVQGQSPSEFAAALDYLHKRPFYKREIEFLEEAIGADDDDEAALARRMRNLRLECLGLWQFMAAAAQRNNVEAMRRMVAAKLVTFADDRDFLPALRRAVAAGADDAASFLVSLAFSNAAALPRSMVSLDSNIQNNGGRSGLRIRRRSSSLGLHPTG